MKWTEASVEGVHHIILCLQYVSCSQTNTWSWSWGRPGVFYSARADGYLDVWDYYEKQHEPVLSQQVPLPHLLMCHTLSCSRCTA